MERLGKIQERIEIRQGYKKTKTMEADVSTNSKADIEPD